MRLKIDGRITEVEPGTEMLEAIGRAREVVYPATGQVIKSNTSMRTETRATGKHTPGPWTTAEDTVGRNLEIRAETRDEIATIPLEFVDVDDMAEVEANARLIAAAPELLHCLKTLCEECDHLDMLEHPEIYGVRMGALETIAKATGE